MPPGSAYRQMNSSTKTMYGDHVILQPGRMMNKPRTQSARPDKRGSSGQAERRRVSVRAATAGVERARRPQSTTGRPSTGAFSSAWIRRDRDSSDSESESDLSTVYDSGSEASGATDDNKQTTQPQGGRAVAWANPAASRQPRAPSRRHDYLRKGGKATSAQQVEQSDQRRKDAKQKMLMEINEERRRAITQRLSKFWAHYPIPEWDSH